MTDENVNGALSQISRQVAALDGKLDRVAEGQRSIELTVMRIDTTVGNHYTEISKRVDGVDRRADAADERHNELQKEMGRFNSKLLKVALGIGVVTAGTGLGVGFGT